MQSSIIQIDTLKPMGTLVDVTSQFNARVGDAFTPITIQWTEGKIAKNLDGLHPVFEAAVGQGHLENGRIQMNADAVPVRWVGDQTSIQNYGQTILKLPPQVFSKEGLCYGHLALENDAGIRETSVDIWFKVLGGVFNMGLACDYFITDFQKALAQAKGDVYKALDDIKQQYQLKIQSAENAIDDNIASLKKLAAAVGAIQAQIDAGNVVTLKQHNHDIEVISQLIEKKLAEMNLTPESFPNSDEIKSTYPNGKTGLFIAEDTGHKWIFWNKQWQDAGPYQGVGIASRSIGNSQLKQATLPLRTTQSSPWVIDYANHKFTVSDYSYFYDEDVHEIPAKDYYLSNFNTVYIGYDAVSEKMDGYEHYFDMPKSSYLIGVVDFVTKQTFMEWEYINSQDVPNSKASLATKVKRENLPAPVNGLVSLLSWTVDTYSENPSVTVNGYAMYFVKNTPFTIKTQTYNFNKNENGAYYLYLDLDYGKGTAELKATDYLGNIAINNPWVGFIETNSHTYRIFDNSNNLSYPFDLITPGKFSVDFDEGILYVPVFWQTVNPLKVWSSNDTVAKIKLDTTQSALFIGIDSSKTKVDEMIVIDPNKQKIQDSYQYIGWVSINTREYDFGKYGSTHDLATQPWINKQVACLGDSITEGDSGEGGLIDSYVPRLKNYLGVAATNYGVSGTTITQWSDRTDSFCERLSKINGQDIVTIFGGINDFHYSRPLGTFKDSADNPNTFYAALKYIVLHLSIQNPKAKLLFITPMKTTKFTHTYDENGSLNKNGDGHTELDYVNAIKQVAEYYSIPVLDMYSQSNFSPYIRSQLGHDNFTVDGLHPTAHGYERIAQTIAHAINNL